MEDGGRYRGPLETARLFVAIRFPADLRQRIAVATRALREHPDVSWGRAEQYHLTLRFLGDVEAGRVSAIAEALRRAASPVAPFALTIEGAGAFPALGRARVVWAGVRATAELNDLNARVQRALDRLGFEPERRDFRPHVTLGRVRRARGGLAELIRGVSLSESTRVTRLSLLQSRLGPGGARHSELAAIQLEGD